MRKLIALLITAIYCFCFIICSAAGAETNAQPPVKVKPERTYTIKGVQLLVFKGAEQAAKNSGVWVDFNSGVLHTPKGEVKTHDLIINDVTRVALIKNKLGRLVVVSVWEGSGTVFLECAQGTVVSICILEINQID